MEPSELRGGGLYQFVTDIRIGERGILYPI